MKIFKGLLSMNTLKLCFAKAKEEDCLYIGVLVETAGHREIISFRSDDFDYKLDYYSRNYDNHLRLKTAPDIVQIKAVAYGESLSDLRRLWSA